MFAQDQPSVLPYAAPFPRPREQRVAPGHLVAVVTAPHGHDVVVWRWFDAVVLDGSAPDSVRLWEPAHGEVVARARNPRSPRPPGSRAYISAGLDGADWWVAGPAVMRAEDADVDVEEVRRFFAAHRLWDHLA